MYATVIKKNTHARTHARTRALFTYIFSTEYYDISIVEQKELSKE